MNFNKLLCSVSRLKFRRLLQGQMGKTPEKWPVKWPVTQNRHELNLRKPLINNGGADQDRTGDPHVANVVLYQLSYCPENDRVGMATKTGCNSLFGGLCKGFYYA